MPLYGADAGSEALFATLKELQQEKSCLENKLINLRQKRAAHEARWDSVSNKYYQVRDINSKMSETLKVAQHKVASTQAQVKELEALNEKKRAQLDEINLAIAQEEQHQTEGRNKFEDHVAGLTSCFSEAKAFYSNPNLAQTIEGTEAESAGLHEQQNNMVKEESGLTDKLQQLQIQKEEEQCPLSLPIPGDTQQLVHDELTCEHGKAQSALEVVSKSVAKLQQKLQEAKKHLKEMTEKHGDTINGNL